ncbi:hypothetical protein PMX31_12770 [Enterocloster clostridioformis]|nr:hypothetical protein [Enterocloster clostridioformis]MDB2142551.1 hypothetical protein [Enterocloster clostridioformis]MDB2149690.1 hypothetical protein [Enterocloster clostridioformis]
MKETVAVEKSIHHLKDSFCVAGRKTQNEKTLHADLLLAGIAQLITVAVADKIHKLGCGHFLGLAKPTSQGSSCTPTGSCFQGISLSAFRYILLRMLEYLSCLCLLASW